ncbi:hypothetical protein EHW97_05730 [Aeromicrobium camelliae]|uniref:ABC transporter n=1 Tax=Aeromicrobium camelliae TaxID=1538144 RepID=A0A3N6WMT1_9ACTN|nr:hypothetical protein [Aeromicrobium camelliae]RQN08749.1 hypothetical protein EHW97_05730 [Aeromicrobium camelliae]
MKFRTACAAVTTTLLLAACSSPGSPDADSPAGHGHGAVSGASEEAEAQYHLVAADAETGAVAIIDLLDESVDTVEVAAPVTSLASDGRFAYVGADEWTHVLDTGVWTWPHGDHNHYYRGELADLDAHGWGDGHAIGGFGTATAAFDDASGEVTVVDRDALEDGEVTTATFDAGEPHHGFALGVGDRLLTSTSSGPELPDGLQWRDHEGEVVEELDVPCADLHGAARVRDTVVVACDGGALVVDADGAELVPYPDGTPPDDRAWSFAQRPHSTELAALRGDAGAWLFDVNARSWTAMDAPNAVATVALGTGLGVLTLDASGTLRHLDAAGAVVAEAPLVEKLDADNPPTIVADAARAYVNDADAGVVHEIDYADALRVSRTIDTDGVAPTFLAETGW